MSKPTELPRWATALLNPSDIVDPTSGKKDIGWQDGEMPPHSFMNWLFNLIYQWTVWLDGLQAEALTWTAAQIFSAGITVTGGATIDVLNLTSLAISGNATIGGTLGVTGTSTLGVTNINAALSVDNPSGNSITGTGHSGTNYIGVHGLGGTTSGNIGVKGEGRGSSGTGVVGLGGGAGPGVSGTGGSTDGTGGDFLGGGSNGAGAVGTGRGSSAGVVGQPHENGPGVWGHGKNTDMTTELGTGSGTAEGGDNAGLVATARNVSSDGGYAAIIAGDASGAPKRAALKLVAQQTLPSIATMGDLCVKVTDGKLYIFNGSAWVTVGSQ